MNAKLLDGVSPGGDRIPLSQLVPLDTPLVIQVFPIYACNFTCKYCTMSIPSDQRKFISDTKKMDIYLFYKCIDNITCFPSQVKVLRFVGMGEPLLHNLLPDMIRYAARSGKFEQIELITNGSRLKPSLVEELVNAGLNRLIISIQGTSSQKYREISNVNINFDKFVENIKYFYEHRKQVKIHIKVADCALDSEYDKLKFFDLFGDICDTIGIEYIGPIHPGVEYNDELSKRSVNQYGEKLVSSDICSQPFYMMQINPDGKVVPCFAVPYPQVLGDCNYESVVDIWNGEKYNMFRYNMLNGLGKTNNVTCDTCTIFKHRTHESDDLETKKQELQNYYVYTKVTD